MPVYYARAVSAPIVAHCQSKMPKSMLLIAQACLAASFVLFGGQNVRLSIGLQSSLGLDAIQPAMDSRSSGIPQQKYVWYIHTWCMCMSKL